MVPLLSNSETSNEEKSILGHLDKQTFEEVYWGEKYMELRKAHRKKI